MTEKEALKLALEALEAHADIGIKSDKAITAIKEALAQPEQEPVAFICEFYADEGYPFVSFEPVTHGTNTPLYTTPPQRKPLTDEQTIILKDTTCPEIDWKARHGVEMNNGERNQWMLDWFRAFKVAIEAAHGIKENT